MHAIAVTLAAVLGTQPAASSCSTGQCPRGAPHAPAAAPAPFVPVPATGPRVVVLTSSQCAGCAHTQQELDAAEHTCARTGVIVSRHDVDAPEAQPLVRRFRPAVVPTFVFLDGEGREAARLEGAQPRERIEQEMANLVNTICAFALPPAPVPRRGGRG